MPARLLTMIACAIASTVLAADRRATLKLLSDDELIAFMRGGAVRYPEMKSEPNRHGIVPRGFWKMPARDAALALVEANRSDEHRKNFKVALKKTSERPPEIGTFVFEDKRRTCGYQTAMAYRLEFSPEKAVLSYGRGADVTLSDGLHETRRGFDFREANAPAAKARHLVQTIWWLRFVALSEKSTNTRRRGGGSMSTGDGSGFMCLRDADGRLEFSANGRIPDRAIAEALPFATDFHETLGLASLIFADEFVRELDADWSTTACCGGMIAGMVLPTVVEPRAPALENLHEVAGRWLRRGFEDPALADEPLCAMALEAATHAGWTDFLALAEQVQARTPLSAAEMRFDETEREIAAWKRERPDLDADYHKSWRRRAYPDDEESKNDRALDTAGAYAALDKLHAEMEGIQEKRDPLVPIRRQLHATADLAVQRLPAANDADALTAWFARDDSGANWAFQRLVQIAPGKAPDALAKRVQATGPEIRNYSLMSFITAVAPMRAREVTATWPVGAAWSKGVTGVALIEGRIPRAEWLQRAIAELDDSHLPSGVFLAVPWQEPLRYGEPELDEALRRLVLKTPHKDESVKPPVEEMIYDWKAIDAMTALAMRHGAAVWQQLTDAWRDVPASRAELLTPLAVVAQTKPEEFGGQFRAFASSPFKAQERKAVLLAIWTADARDMQPQLEAVATAKPDDPEMWRSADTASEVPDPKFQSHLARKIVALWREPDAVTRAKLLLAFGTTEFRDTADFQTHASLGRLSAEFSSSVRALDAAQRESLQEFIARLERDEWRQQQWIYSQHAPREVLRAARAQLDTP